MSPLDISPDGARWMTYSALGKARGISRASAERLARRNKWQRQGGNDGFARVLVPVEFLIVGGDAPTVVQARRTDALAVLRVAVETLREQLAAGDVRAGKLTADLADARADVHRAEARANAADADRDRLAAMLVQAEAKVKAAASALQAADAAAAAEVRARAARPLLARLRQAWGGG